MSGEKKGHPGMIVLTIRTSISNFNLGGLQSSKLSGKAKKEDLDITLDDPAVKYIQIGFGELSNICA